MSQKNIIICLVAVIIGLIGLIFMVKSSSAKQAQEFVKPIQEKAKYQLSQAKDIIDNNNLLWSLIDSTWKSSDKSKAFVKRLADSQKLPRCNGKECAGDEARLITTISNNANDRSIKVGWAKYSFKVIYDSKDKFVTIDANDLLGKTSEPVEEEEEETAE